MAISFPPQGVVAANASAIKNTDAEIRDGVWADSTKADGVNLSHMYGNTSATKIITDALPDDGNLTSLGNLANQTHILVESTHCSYIFPENTSYTVTMHTGIANAYGPYNVIKDDQNNTFSDKFNNTEGHISSILIEDASIADKTYQYEISYGASHTSIIEYRFHSATNQVGPTSQTRVRPCVNPAGEVLYYRGMCENASANAEISFRYHFHS